MDVTAIRHYPDTAAEASGIGEALGNESGMSEVSDRLGDILIDRLGTSQLDQAQTDAAIAAARSSMNERLRERLTRLQTIMADATEHGDGTLTTINVGFITAPDLVGELERRDTSFAFSGDRLYFVIRGRIWTYDRVATIAGNAPGDWANGGRHAWEWQLDLEYADQFNRCVMYQRSELPVEECRAHRDRMAEFGVELKPEFVLERFRDFPKPSNAELDFWRNQYAPQKDWSITFPALEYCFSSVSSSESVQDFVASLARSGFSNTLWRLSIPSSAPLETPRNWTDEEFMAWAPGGDRQLSSLEAAVFLRADGGLGFGPDFAGLGFDPGNAWSYAGGVIQLSFRNGAAIVDLPVGDYVNLQGSTNLALADGAFAQLILGNYDLLANMPRPEQHPDYERLRPFTENGRCDTGGITTTITESPPPVEPTVDWPTRPASAFPSHWHARTDMTDGSEHPDADSWREMQAGGYYHLLGADSGRSGRLGVNIDAPTGYGYAPTATWSVSGRTMTWQWDQYDSFVFELPESYDGTLTAVGQNNPQYTMVLTPTDLLTPGSRRLERASEPTAESSPSADRSPPSPVEAPPELEQPTEPQPELLVGVWRWSNGLQIKVDADGSASNGIAAGRWSSGKSSREFEIEWPAIEDRITISADEQTLNGVGAIGVQYTARRVDGDTGIVGRWRRQDGVILQFSADGSVAGGPLTGRWSKSGGNYVVSWPLVDAVTVSPSGDRLEAVNQFGQVTATRQ